MSAELLDQECGAPCAVAGCSKRCGWAFASCDGDHRCGEHMTIKKIVGRIEDDGTRRVIETFEFGRQTDLEIAARYAYAMLATWPLREARDKKVRNDIVAALAKAMHLEPAAEVDEASERACAVVASPMYGKIRPILDNLDREMAKPCDVDSGGFVTNHMRAAWRARDLILELLADQPLSVEAK